MGIIVKACYTIRFLDKPTDIYYNDSVNTYYNDSVKSCTFKSRTAIDKDRHITFAASLSISNLAQVFMVAPLVKISSISNICLLAMSYFFLLNLNASDRFCPRPGTLKPL